jgi:RNA polymerase-associated protein RTF1
MEKKTGKKRKATTAGKKVTKKTKDATAGDASLAEALSEKRESGRNKDAKGTKATKAKALAALREERKRSIRKEESSESESDFGDDDEDSDDDYDEGPALKPWQKKTAAKSNASRLDQAVESDDDDDEEMEDMTGAGAAPKKQAVFVEADLEGYQKITLPRRRLARWCNEPFFEDAVTNYYVKLFVGENEAGKRCYRLCKIVGIKSEGATYTLPAVRNEKPISTDKMLVLQFGNNERSFPIKLISDVKVTEEDINQYITAMRAVRKSTISKRDANVLRRKQDDLVNNYTYTLEDIERNIQERKKKGATSASNLSSEQMRAAIATKAAQNALDEAKRHQAEMLKTDDQQQIAKAEERVLQLKGQLEERQEEERMLLERAKSRKQKLAERSKDKKWAKVNQRSVQMNQQADFGAYKNQERVEETAADGKPKFNPYARRKVKPKILWEVGQNEEKEGDEKTADARKESDKGKASNENIAPTLIQEQQEKAAALSQSHQFSIDEEVLALSSYTKGIAGLSEKKKLSKRFRKGLSLTDYQEKKASGTL